MLNVNQTGLVRLLSDHRVGHILPYARWHSRRNFNLDPLSTDFEHEEDLVEGFVFKQLLRDQPLVDVNGGVVQVDEGHKELHDLFYVDPVVLILHRRGLNNVSTATPKIT